MPKIDKFDRILLQELDRDASQPLHQLAKKLRRSKQFVSFRIKRMEQEGIITGYTALLDLLALGYFPFRIYIDFERMTEDGKQKFVQAMKKYPQIVHILLIREKWDLALFLLVEDIQEFRELWDSILVQYRPYIKHHLVSLYAPLHNFNKSFLAQNIKTERALGYAKFNRDVDIPFALRYAENVRQTIVELSRKTKKSPKTVLKIISSLEKEKIILGYSLLLNPLAFEYSFYLVSLILKEGKHTPELFHYCKSIPEVYQINRIIGGDDMELLFMIEDKHKLLKIVDQLKEIFSQSIVDETIFEFVPAYSKGIIPI